MHRISVVTAVYNNQDYVSQSIQTILSQTFKDFELIMVDDGSIDKSLKMMESFRDKRIKIISNDTNKGLIYSLNRGIQNISDCEFIARMDSDDLATRDRFEKQTAYFSAHPKVSLLGSAMRYFGEAMRPKIYYQPGGHQQIISTFFCYNPFFHPTVMMRSHLKPFLHYSDEFFKYEDYALWISIMNKAVFANIPDVILHYRKHESNVTNSYKKEPSIDVERFKKVLNLLKNRLNLDLNQEQIEQLAIISSASRSAVNPNIAWHDLKALNETLMQEAHTKELDVKLLEKLITERILLYLISSKRTNDILKLITNREYNKNLLSIARRYLSGKKGS